MKISRLICLQFISQQASSYMPETYRPLNIIATAQIELPGNGCAGKKSSEMEYWIEMYSFNINF